MFWTAKNNVAPPSGEINLRASRRIQLRSWRRNGLGIISIVWVIIGLHLVWFWRIPFSTVSNNFITNEMINTSRFRGTWTPTGCSFIKLYQFSSTAIIIASGSIPRWYNLMKEHPVGVQVPRNRLVLIISFVMKLFETVLNGIRQNQTKWSPIMTHTMLIIPKPFRLQLLNWIRLLALRLISPLGGATLFFAVQNIPSISLLRI
jgi:hypothetical protein